MICAETRWTSEQHSRGGRKSRSNSGKMSTEGDLHHRVVFNSPLWRKDYIRPLSTPALTPEQIQELESHFILDCISIEKKRYKWSPDIIPKYDALNDYNAQAYFLSPLVKSVLKKTVWSNEKKDVDGEDQVQSRITLSGRQRLPRPRTAAQLQDKRDDFVIDSVEATNAVTKYPFRPLVPTYNSLNDRHSASYLRKRAVKSVMAKTMPAEIARRAMIRRTKVGAQSTGRSSIDSLSQVPVTSTCTPETSPPVLPKLATQKSK